MTSTPDDRSREPDAIPAPSLNNNVKPFSTLPTGFRPGGFPQGSGFGPPQSLPQPLAPPPTAGQQWSSPPPAPGSFSGFAPGGLQQRPLSAGNAFMQTPLGPPIPGQASTIGPRPSQFSVKQFAGVSGPPIPGHPSAVAPPPPQPTVGQFTGVSGPPIPGYPSAAAPPPSQFSGAQFSGVSGPQIPGYPSGGGPPTQLSGGQFSAAPGPPISGYASAMAPPPQISGGQFPGVTGLPNPGYPGVVAPPPSQPSGGQFTGIPGQSNSGYAQAAPPLPTPSGGSFSGAGGPPMSRYPSSVGAPPVQPLGGQFNAISGPSIGAPGPYGLPSSFGNLSLGPKPQAAPSSTPSPLSAPPQFGRPFPNNQYGAPLQSNYNAGPPISSSLPPSDGQASYGPPPPMGYGNDPTSRTLPEEFQSLSMVPLPGSMEPGIDPALLPRPLDDTDPPAPTWAASCHPRYLRLTSNAMPNSHSLVARWHLPLGAVVHPLAEAPPGEEVPVVSFGATSIVRCRRCRAYINPHVTFTDAGRRWRCNVCVLLNEVPVEYFCPIDANGRRKDADERPELSQASVEYVASTEYMVRPPMPPGYFFLIDVSVSAIKTGMLQVACETIKSCLDKLPGFPRTQIGFITFDSTLHFYSLKSSLTQPQMMVVAELDDPFLPMPDDLLVNLSESRQVVEALLDSLPAMFQNNVNVESALGPALKASFMVMSQLGGKLLVFQSTLPSLGVGRLKLRGDDPRIYGTERECTLRVTEEQFYKQMAADFSKYQIGVNIYAFAEKYIDLASLGTLSKYTGGQVIYYPGYQAHMHSKKFSYELARDLSRETAWEAVMRIRCGKGIRFSTFHGHFMMRSSDLLALPAVDVDKAFAMQLTLEDTLLTSQTVYFQVALLYTSSSGERRIRVHTMATPVTTDLGEMYRSADVGAIASIMSRLAIEKSLVSKLEDARQATQARLVKSLREYRNLFAVQHRTSGRLIFPESLKLLPLYVLAINKSLALRGSFNDVYADDRSAAAFEMQIMPIPRLLRFLYPSLYRFDDYLYQNAKIKPDTKIQMPISIPLTAERLDPRGAYFLDDGLRFVLWVGKVLPLEFTGLLYGTEVAQSADSSKVIVVPQNNDLSKYFLSFLDKLRAKNRALYQECSLVRQGEQPRESHLLLSNLVEDRSAPPFGYVEWVIQIHRLVQQNS